MARGSRNNNIKVVPESKQALNAMKYEIAAELGLNVGKPLAHANVEFATELGSMPSQTLNEEYWGYIATRDTGAVGGTITQRLIKRAEEMLLNL